MTFGVRCPSPACRAVFELPAERLGRNVYCLDCGKRMTARPLQVSQEPSERQKLAARREGAAIPRLPLAALLDNIRSLWNVGSMFRTADGLSVEHVYLAGITGVSPRPQITKTALGAEEAVGWSYFTDASEALEAARAAGYTPVGLECSPRAVAIEELEWPERVCLVVGNEVAGVSRPVLDACPLHVFIPMLGVKESFNVAVAFGIACHQAALALRARPKTSANP